MPNLWFCNMDEEAQNINPLDSERVCRDIPAENARNLFNLCPTDIAVYPFSIDTQFIEYCTEFTGGKVILMDSTVRSSEAVDKLRLECSNKQYILRSYIQTQKALLFAQTIGTQWEGTPDHHIQKGLIAKANSKIFIKSIADSAGIKVAPYLCASNLNDLLKNIDHYGSEYRNQLFLKKDGMCGGLGNLSGSIDELKKILPDWYHAGNMLLEPLLPIQASLGSFVDIQSNHIEFLGVDEQFFNGYEWGGFIYPHHNEKLTEKIKDLSCQMAERLRDLGLLGPANFDWLVMASDYPEAALSEGDIVFGECNFRRTGVHPAMNFAHRYFRETFPKINIKAHIQYSVSSQYNTFKSLYEKLLEFDFNGKKLMCKPSLDNPQPGIIISQPPVNNVCGITIFSYDRSELDKYSQVIAEALS